MNKLILAFLLFTFSLPGFTHPGSVDTDGGHVDQSTEKYHCHLEPCFALNGQAQDLNQITNEDIPAAHNHVHIHELYPGTLMIALFIVTITLFIYRKFLRKKKQYNLVKK